MNNIERLECFDWTCIKEKLFRVLHLVKGIRSLNEQTHTAGEVQNVTIDELQCVRQSLQGDSDAFEKIIRKHEQHIGKILWRFTRDSRIHCELVQDVFVEAFLSLHTYKAKAPLEHWLARIAVRIGYRHWKQRKRQRKTEAFSFEQWDQIAQSNEPETISSQAAGELVHGLLAQLPLRDRLVLTLRYLQQHDVATTAELTGWSRSMVKVQTHRARNRLRKLFEKSGREFAL